MNVEVCNSSLAVSSANIQVLNNTIYNDPHSLKHYWRAASFARAYMDEATSTVINLRLPCDQFPITSCEVTNWHNYARNNPDVLSGRNYSHYQFQVKGNLRDLK